MRKINSEKELDEAIKKVDSLLGLRQRTDAQEQELELLSDEIWLYEEENDPLRNCSELH